MSMKKNVRKSSGGKGSPQVGASTTYSYGKSGSKGRNNMSPVKGIEKSGR